MKTKDIRIGQRYGVTTRTKWQEVPAYLTEVEVVRFASRTWDGKTIVVRYPNGADPERLSVVRPVDVRCTWGEAVALREQVRVRWEQYREVQQAHRERLAAAEEAWRTAGPALADALKAAGFVGVEVSRWQTGGVKVTPEAAASLAEFINAAAARYAAA